MTLPNAFLVGAVRGGTTSLSQYLAQHPDVFVPRVKEPHYFSNVPPSGLFVTAARRILHRHPVGSRPMPSYRLSGRAYKRMYRHAHEPVRLDASTSHLMDPAAPNRIHDVAPNARILITLRDPVERAYSHYLMDRRRGRQKLPFAQALQADRDFADRRWGRAPLYWEQGEYVRGVRRYLELFGPERVMILAFSDLTRNTRQSLAQVCQFLGISEDGLEGVDLTKAHNAYGEPQGLMATLVARSAVVSAVGRLLPTRVRNQVLSRINKPGPGKAPMDPEARRMLEEHYAPLLRELEALIGPQPSLWPWSQDHGGSPATDANTLASRA